MAKSNMWIYSEKAKVSRAENLGIPLGLFLIFSAKQSFTKLKQVFIETLILNHFDLQHQIQIERDVSFYVIGGIFN